MNKGNVRNTTWLVNTNREWTRCTWHDTKDLSVVHRKLCGHNHSNVFPCWDLLLPSDPLMVPKLLSWNHLYLPLQQRQHVYWFAVCSYRLQWRIKKCPVRLIGTSLATTRETQYVSSVLCWVMDSCCHSTVRLYCHPVAVGTTDVSYVICTALFVWRNRPRPHEVRTCKGQTSWVCRVVLILKPTS